MKIIIILTTFFSSVVFAQELITKHNFENIQYVEDIEWYGDEIYCSGYTFNTKINEIKIMALPASGCIRINATGIKTIASPII